MAKKKKKQKKSEKKNLISFWLKSILAGMVFFIALGISYKINFEKEPEEKITRNILEKSEEKISAEIILTIVQDKNNPIEINQDSIYNLENFLETTIGKKIIYTDSPEAEKIITDLNIKKTPFILLPQKIKEEKNFEKIKPYLSFYNENIILNLNLIGQKKFFILNQIGSHPDSLPRLGKDGAEITAYLFTNFENENELKITTEVLPSLEKYISDGIIKIYWSPSNPNKNDTSYRGTTAAHCIQKYSDEFFWKFLEELTNQNFPPEYSDLLSANRIIQLNEYAFARCVRNNTYDEIIQTESSFAENLNITNSPTLIIGQHIFEGEINPEEVLKTINESYGINDYFKIKDNQKDKPIFLNEPRIGEGNNKIILYSNFDCKSCKKIEKTLEEIRTTRSDLEIIFRNFYTTENGEIMALASECAHAHNLFWPYHDLLLTLKEEPTKDYLIEQARALHIHPLSFKKCLLEETYKEEIKQDKKEITQKGFVAPPVLCINTTCKEGALTKNQILEMLN